MNYILITSVKEFRDSIKDPNRDVWYKFPLDTTDSLLINARKVIGDYFELQHTSIEPENIQNLSEYIPWIETGNIYYTLKEINNGKDL